MFGLAKTYPKYLKYQGFILKKPRPFLKAATESKNGLSHGNLMNNLRYENSEK